MRFFASIDPLLIIPGAQPIVVAAPHHGTRPRANSDLATGPIARAVAARLQARAVIASDMRRRVDINKNPLALPQGVRHYALRYQNVVFEGLPPLVIEIHGQAHGNYPVELSAGFDLDPGLPGDMIFENRLRILKGELSHQLRKIGLPVDVGVYPLDPDVRKTATNTYTFQKIRRARKRVGLEWYGLHIELDAELRTGRRARIPGFIDALAGALATGIASAFHPLPPLGVRIATMPGPVGDEPQWKAALFVMKAPQDPFGLNAALLHPQEMSRLELLDGDRLCLDAHGESMDVPARASKNIPPGRIAIPARIRSQLDLRPQEEVGVSAAGSGRPEAGFNPAHAFVIGCTRPEKSLQVWAPPATLETLQAGQRDGLFCTGPFKEIAPVPIHLAPQDDLAEGVIQASQALVRKLVLSIGDTIMIGPRP